MKDSGTNKLNGNKNPLNMLDAVTNLKKAGFDQEQAEAVVRMQYDLIDSQLSTKQDIAGIKRDIKELDLKIESIKAELKRDMKELEVNLKKDMTIKIYRSVALVLAGIFAMSKLGLLSM